jgi:hypothetical protein
MIFPARLARDWHFASFFYHLFQKDDIASSYNAQAPKAIASPEPFARMCNNSVIEQRL